MPWQPKPHNPDLLDEPQFYWPSHLVGLRQEALFGDLHDRYNTVPFNIRDQHHFHQDVFELSIQAHDKKHFYKLMQERTEKRLKEQKEAFEDVIRGLTGGYSKLSDEQGFRCTRLSCFASYDCLVEFLASLLCPNRHGEEPFTERTSLPYAFLGADKYNYSVREPKRWDLQIAGEMLFDPIAPPITETKWMRERRLEQQATEPNSTRARGTSEKHLGQDDANTSSDRGNVKKVFEGPQPQRRKRPSENVNGGDVPFSKRRRPMSNEEPDPPLDSPDTSSPKPRPRESQPVTKEALRGTRSRRRKTSTDAPVRRSARLSQRG